MNRRPAPLLRASLAGGVLLVLLGVAPGLRGEPVAAAPAKPRPESELRAEIVARTRTLGSEHPDTLRSRHNLAVALWIGWRNAQAEAGGTGPLS